MAPKPKQTKAAIAAAASSGGKGKKKKWSKGRSKDKLNNSVILTPAIVDKLMGEITKSKLITPSIISEKLRLNVSLARNAIKSLEALKLIEVVGSRHHAQLIYTRVGGAAATTETEKPVVAQVPATEAW